MLRPAIFCAFLLAAACLHAADLASAEANLKRIEALVEAGAAPQSALRAAQLEFQDARDDEFLRKTLFSGSVDLDQLPEMLRAASGLRDRALEALESQRKLVDAGVSPARSLDVWQQKVAMTQRQWELAQSRVKLVNDLADIAQREAELTDEMEQQAAQRVHGKGTLTSQDFLFVETAYFEQFSRPLPVSARGTTSIHREMGFDHRDRFDVALNPDQEEGRWLMRLLDRLRVPYIAFRQAVAGRATGAHIHVGLPSPKL